MTLTEKQSKIIYDTVKELQPDCLINSRLGNGLYDYVSLGDNEIPKTKE
jgi:alpha-L-fucosidase